MQPGRLLTRRCIVFPVTDDFQTMQNTENTSGRNIINLADHTKVLHKVYDKFGLTIVVKASRHQDEERYIIYRDGNRRSLEVEDLYSLYRAIQNELYRIGRLANHKQAVANWNATHKEQKKAAQRIWSQSHKDKVNEYARKSREKKRQAKLAFDNKLKLLEQEDAIGKVGFSKPCPLCFSHMIKLGRLWECAKCHKILDAHEMQILR